MSDSSSPIGVFDSGLGGISVLREMVRLMPEENYIYYGDSKHAPYGTRTLEDIRQLSSNCVDFLLDKGCKAIVIACNTATSASAEILREKYPDIPIIGIEPALKPAVLWKENDKVAVLATPVTLTQEKFLNLLHTYEGHSEIYCVPCPGLADIVERGEFNTPETKAFLEDILNPYVEKGLDAVVLGCTHYPFVEPTIQEIVGKDVKIFNGSLGTAKELKRQLEEHGIKSTKNTQGVVTMYNSSDDPKIIEFSNKLLHC